MNTRNPRNFRNARRSHRRVPLPAPTAADAVLRTPETLGGGVRNAGLPSYEVMQPLIEYVVQELLARLVADLPTQCVIHVSMNARGTGQFELRRTYPTLDVAKAQVQCDITDLVQAIRAGLQDSRVTLASDGQ